MQFPALPGSRGDTHLFVTLSGRCASWLLVAVDYDRNEHAVEYKAFPIPENFRSEEFDLFLADGLRLWAEEIGWDLLSCDDDLCMLSLCEGDCVDGVTFIADEEFSENSYHSLVLGSNAKIYGDQAYIDAAAHFFTASGADHLVYAVLNWNEIRVYYVESKRDDDSERENIVVREMKIESSFLDSLAETTVLSVLGVSMRKDVLIDTIANMRGRPLVRVFSEDIQDVARSFVTAGLFSMKEKLLQSFGMEGDKDVLLITGEIPRILSQRMTILSVIDGLQLRGRYEISVDPQVRSLPASVSAKTKDFIFPMHIVFQDWYLYISTEKGGSGRIGRTAYRGMIGDPERGGEEPRELIVGQTGRIESYPMRNGESVFLEPARSVYFPNMYQKSEDGHKYLVADASEWVKSVIIDCRKIPVVYGPDAQVNHQRVSGWIRGLPKLSENSR